MNKAQWPFSSPPNEVVFTSKKITSGDEWVYYVSHDSDDGAWQFHPYEFTLMEDASIVGLGTICKLDPSLLELYDLPEGWYAWRKSPDSGWIRCKQENEKNTF